MQVNTRIIQAIFTVAQLLASITLGVLLYLDKALFVAIAMGVAALFDILGLYGNRRVATLPLLLFTVFSLVWFGATVFASVLSLRLIKVPAFLGADVRIVGETWLEPSTRAFAFNIGPGSELYFVVVGLFILSAVTSIVLLFSTCMVTVDDETIMRKLQGLGGDIDYENDSRAQSRRGRDVAPLDRQIEAQMLAGMTAQERKEFEELGRLPATSGPSISTPVTSPVRAYFDQNQQYKESTSRATQLSYAPSYYLQQRHNEGDQGYGQSQAQQRYHKHSNQPQQYQDQQYYQNRPDYQNQLYNQHPNQDYYQNQRDYPNQEYVEPDYYEQSYSNMEGADSNNYDPHQSYYATGFVDPNGQPYGEYYDETYDGRSQIYDQRDTVKIRS